MHISFATVNLPHVPLPPTTTDGRRGVASTASILVHVAILAAALSGFWPKYNPPVVPPDMVVEMVIEPPPPPPEPEHPKALPQPLTPPQPTQLPPPKAMPRVKPTVVPQTTTPSPDADALPAPAPVAQIPAPVVEEKVAQPPPPPVAKAAFDPRQYLPGIKERVQSKVVYPTLSLKRGEQGTVNVKAILSPDGSVEDATADEDSNSGRLREAAIKAVKDGAPYPHMVETVKVTIPVVFEIR